jgi:hypothetical protein
MKAILRVVDHTCYGLKDQTIDIPNGSTWQTLLDIVSPGNTDIVMDVNSRHQFGADEVIIPYVERAICSHHAGDYGRQWYIVVCTL